MPRYYFHLYEGDAVLVDSEGIDLGTLQAVRSRALVIARDLIAADTATGLVDLDTVLHIVDDDDALVHRLCFSEAVAFRSRGAK